MKILKKNNLEKFVSPKTGLVNNIYHYARGTDDPTLHHLITDTPDFTLYPGIQRSFPLQAGGTKIKHSDARNAAVGEVLERYALNRPYKTQIHRIKSVTRNSTLKYRDLNWFHPNQWENIPFDKPEKSDELAFLEGKTLEGEPVSFPAQFLIYNYEGFRSEKKIGYPMSVGCATGYTVYETVTQGILEQIERDSVLLAWFGETNFHELDIDNSQEVNSLKNNMRWNTPQIRLIDVTSNLGIPTVLGIALDPNRRIEPVFSYATRSSMEKAAKSAVVELGQSWIGKKQQYTLNGSRPKKESVYTQVEDFLSQAAGVSEITSDIKSQPESLRSTLIENGYNTYIFDLTPPEAEEEGLNVIKTVIPDLVQFGRLDAPFLGNSRFLKSSSTYENASENLPPFLHESHINF